jgi:hypothetical protein
MACQMVRYTFTTRRAWGVPDEPGMETSMRASSERLAATNPSSCRNCCRSLTRRGLSTSTYKPQRRSAVGRNGVACSHCGEELSRVKTGHILSGSWRSSPRRSAAAGISTRNGGKCCGRRSRRGSCEAPGRRFDRPGGALGLDHASGKQGCLGPCHALSPVGRSGRS